MCVSQRRWTGYRGQCSPALLLVLLPLYFLSSTPPFAQGAIHIPKDYKVHNMSQPPVLTELPTSYTAFSREEISLTCEATGNPPPIFRWVKDGESFGPVRKSSGTLRAEGAEPLSDYQGYYRCYASNTLGTAMTHTIKLTTEPRPHPPRQEKIHKKVDEGESMILPCDPPKSSIPTVFHWMDKRMIHIRQSERVVMGLDGNLYFANVLKNDSRKDYICNAQYSEARTILLKDAISLTVTPSNDVVRHRKPHFFRHPDPHSSVLALRGQSLTLECIPRGLPTPKVEWKKKDGTLEETSGEVENHDRRLHFESITQEDDGEYECRATNTQGSAVHSFTVTVEAEPYWVKEPQNLLYSPGETVRLDCQAEGIPTPIVTWSINGVPIAEVDEDPRRSVSGGVLILRDVEFADTAVYQCEATNKHGNILINTYIYVIELPPQILSSDGVVYRVTESRDVSLHCETFGSPRPHVTWEGEDMEPLLSDPRVSLLTNGTIELSNASREDSGAYTCTVKHTNISIIAYLEVLNRTVILVGPQHVRPHRGTSALLDCQFYKDPRLLHQQTVWKKDGAKLQEDNTEYTVFENSTLKLANVQPKDTGHYSCEIITDLDHVQSSGSIIVVAPPDPPKALGLSDVQDRSLTLSWIPGQQHNSPVTVFIVEGREEQHSEEKEWKWEEWRRVEGDVNHLELTLQPYSTYRFRVIGVNELGPSDPSQASIAHSTPPAVPDSNPTSVRSDSTDPGTLIIKWDPMDKRLHNGEDFQYKVLWREAEGSGPHWMHGYAKAPPFLVNGTGTYTPFEIKVQAVNALGEGPPPIPDIGHSGEDVPLEAPGGVQVTVINNTATVRWDHAQRVQGLLLGYKIDVRRLGPQGVRGRRALEKQLHEEEREREGAERGMDREEERKVVEVYGMTNSKEVTELRLYSRYELSVAAFNSKGEGPYSPPEHFSTPEGAPGPPASLRFDSPSETELALYWTPPIQTNGKLLGYILQYQQEVESGVSQVEMKQVDAMTTYHVWDYLDPNSHYIFKVTARTAAGEGLPITRRGATLLDGGLPINISMVPAETSINLTWVPGERYRNHAFRIRYLRKSVGGEWAESEMVNSTQGFYTLPNLQPGTEYHLAIKQGNDTAWDRVIWTKGPELSEMDGGFATQGWFIGLISAIVLLMLILLILCFIKRSKGGKYAVKDKEDGQVDSEARPMKDETFGEYRSLESDGDEKRSVSQPSLCVESKLGSEDSLAEYGDSVDIQFNEDGSFIGQYSGRGAVPHGNESSGPASPVNPVPPPPIAPSMSTILDRPS